MSDTPPTPAPAEPTPPATSPRVPPRPPGARLRLIVAAALFVGWLGWLGVTALTKTRAPAVSHAQAAGADAAVVVRLEAGEGDAPTTAATVEEPLTASAPTGTIIVTNLPKASGYTGPGKYLLLLSKESPDGPPLYRITGQQRSPGADIADVGPPRIYPWTDATAADIRKQVKALFP